MVKQLDSHSKYVKRSEIRGARHRGESPVAGVGLELASTPEGPRIIGVIDGSPSALAGLARGDLLVAVGDAQLRDRPLSDVIGLIVDLRWCPGGLLVTAGAVATVLVPPGSLIAETQGQDLERRHHNCPNRHIGGVASGLRARCAHSVCAAISRDSTA
jgi:C-terminal processing protease CtpA/Prc